MMLFKDFHGRRQRSWASLEQAVGGFNSCQDLGGGLIGSCSRLFEVPYCGRSFSSLTAVMPCANKVIQLPPTNNELGSF